MLQCEVAEAGDPEADEAPSKQEFAQRILANPAKAAKINAAKRTMSLYKSYRNVAEKIKAEFDAMGGLA